MTGVGEWVILGAGVGSNLVTLGLCIATSVRWSRRGQRRRRDQW